MQVSFISDSIFWRFAAKGFAMKWWNLCRRISFAIALKHKHGACAASLNPRSIEPLIWPSPPKFISELNQQAKAILENVLMNANKEREKNDLKDTAYWLPSLSHSDVRADDDFSEVYLFPTYIKYQSKFTPRVKLLGYLEVLKILNMKYMYIHIHSYINTFMYISEFG